MVVTSSRPHAVRYKQAFDKFIAEQDYQDVRVLVAFSGVVKDPDLDDAEYTEVAMNKGIQDVIEEVVSGRSAVGIVATTYVARQLDVLQPIVSFGAARNSMLSQTPTFAEVTGNPKLAFTESFGLFGPPKMDPAVADRLAKALISAGQDRGVIDGAEAANVPLAITGPEVLAGTLERNARVLEEILG